MDEELLQLFLEAKKGNRNVAGLLNNLDNEMLAFLAGVYTPDVDQGGMGTLWSSYAGNPDYPVVQDIISKIEGGADPYYLGSYIDSLGGNTDSFQPEDLKGLTRALYKEYTGSKKKDDVWSKAGLRSPLDVYSVEDVPISESVAKLIEPTRELYNQRFQELQGAQSRSRRAQQESLQFEPGRKALKEAKPAWQQQIINRIIDPEGAGIFPEFIEKRKMPLVKGTVGEVAAGAASDVLSSGAALTAALLFGKGWNPFKKGSRRTDFSKAEKAMSQKQKALQAEAAAEEAGREEEWAARRANAAANREMAQRRGVLRAYQEMGITPAKDQMRTLLSYLGNK